jgi:hypothetical protein
MKGWCPACSNFAITNNSLQFAKEAGKLHLLVAFLRRLPSDAWTENFQEIDLRNIQSVLSQVAEPEILEQFDLALRFICEMCSEVGVPSTFDFKTDWPLLVAHSRRGAHYILRQLAETGYLRAPNGRLNPPRPTRKAYERLLEIRSSGHLSLNGFVAMSFSPDRDAVWKEIIKPAILAAGYRPVRVDQYEHNRRIDDEIIAQIKRCRFLVADFTQQKQGVYFEAGPDLPIRRNPSSNRGGSRVHPSRRREKMNTA